jgi:hypothetical protein
MKTQFVPYNIAKKLRDLGFDEDCLAYYDPDGTIRPIGPLIFYYDGLSRNSGYQDIIAAPLWQQVTKWLRDTKKINVFVGFRPNTKKWDSFYYDMNLNGKEYVKFNNLDKFMKREVFNTYEEALESVIIDYINNSKMK